jgi:hypothetical protein
MYWEIGLVYELTSDNGDTHGVEPCSYESIGADATQQS